MELPTRIFVLMVFIIKLIALVVFLKGFFPVKHSMSGFAAKPTHTEPTTPHGTPPDVNHIPESLPKTYHRLVLVLIDALRADFVLPGGTGDLPQMEFVKTLIERNKTYSYMAKAHPPTVTMPRIKALTTGGIPGFIDVVMNFDSQSVEEDNLVSQLYRGGRRIVFYGDDTWIRLFPGHFVRTDGTTSFFVADYTEVDVNVTRHLDKDLLERDWDVLILHYLGLDHIGHLAGPLSPLVPHKLQEMDDVIRRIYNSLNTEISDGQSLLVLCGDHGMSDQGSHGGSSLSETSTPLVFIDPKWADGEGRAYNADTVEQIDLAPTLALLLGVPIPQNNLGALIIDVLSGLSPRDTLRATYTNSQQLLKVLKQNIDDFEREPCYLHLQRAEQSHIAWIQMYHADPDSQTLHILSQRVQEQYMTAMTGMREKLSGMLLHYDLHAMAVSIVVLWGVLIVLILQLATGGSTRYILFKSTWFISVLIGGATTFIHVSVCTSNMASEFLCTGLGSLLILLFNVFITVVAVSVIEVCRSNHMWSLSLKKLYTGDVHHMLLVVGTILHTLSLLSSSFVEEEHQTWYFLTVTVHLVYMWKVFTVRYTNIPQDCDRYVTDCYSNDTDRHGDSLMFNTSSADKKSTSGEVYQRRARTADGGKLGASSSDDQTPGMNSQATDESYSTSKCREWMGVVCSVCLLVLCRVARSWNQTGDKWTHLPDVGDWLNSPGQLPVLSILVIISLMFTTVHVCVSNRSLTTRLLFLFGSAGVYCFRAANGALWDLNLYSTMTKGLPEAQFVFNIILLMILSAWYNLLKSHNQTTINITSNTQITVSTESETSKTRAEISNIVADIPRNSDHSTLPPSVSAVILSYRHLCCDLQSSWILLMMLLLRPHNILLVAIVVWQEYLVRFIVRRTGEINATQLTLLYYWMGQAAFFYQGNSNSISTVDVSAGYIGLETYQPVIIGVLMCLSTYAMPIYWLLSVMRTFCDVAVEQKWKPSRCVGGYSLYVLLQLLGLFIIARELGLNHVLLDVMTVLGLCRAVPLAVYTVLVTSQRYHLFVWTVFSPKLLYEGMLTVVITAVVFILAGASSVL